MQPDGHTSCDAYFRAWCEHVEPLPDYCVVFSVPSRIGYRNAQARIELGVTIPTTTVEDAFRLVHEEDRAEVLAAAERAIRTGHAGGIARAERLAERVTLNFSPSAANLTQKTCRAIPLFT